MPKDYDELHGAIGRAVFFRPERARVRDFLSPHAQPRLLLDDELFPVFDMSMNGVSYLVHGDHPRSEPGTEVGVSLLVHGRAIYEGRARVARVEETGSGARVALALTRGFIDLPALARQDAEERMHRELALGADPYRGLIDPEYSQALARVVLFVQFYREVINGHEARYKAIGGTEGRQAINRLERIALDALRGPWTELRLATCEATRNVVGDRAMLHAAKQLTETVLTPLLLDSPCVRRAYEKPLGYPGDYQVMLYCYNHALEGESVFGRVFHKLWLEHPLPSGVRTRRDLVVDLAIQEHERLVAQQGDGSHLRITVLGCGPAQEVPSFVAKRGTWPGRVTWTLIDQDEEALSVAFKTAQPAAAEVDSEMALRCLNLSFTQLVQDPGHLPVNEPQHLISSSGLFDYLRKTAAQDLLRELYRRLAPGGLLAVGNAIGPNEDYWSPEFVLDWTLVYRTREEMAELAATLPQGAQAEVISEPGGAYYYLLVRKPRDAS